jgi:hypothetical protein
MDKVKAISTTCNKVQAFFGYPCYWFKKRFPVYMDSTDSRWGLFTLLVSLALFFAALSASFFVGGTMIFSISTCAAAWIAGILLVISGLFMGLAIWSAVYFLKHPRHDQTATFISDIRGDIAVVKEDIGSVRKEIPLITSELKNINETLKSMRDRTSK